MTLERKIFLITANEIDVTKLSYVEMMFYSNHNINLFVDCLIAIKQNKRK